MVIKMNSQIYQNMHAKNNLSAFATKDDQAIYYFQPAEDLRSSFFHDIDKIIYSLSYIRYMDKTQVFPNAPNDHIQNRMLHVQYVAKIARTMGRALKLNEDLIEAAALGHDLGHTPFGHAGEKIIDKISHELNQGYFCHNVNSVRNLLFIENYGKGHNISLQVIDAIMCHNGMMESNIFKPVLKTKESFLQEYYQCYTDPATAKHLKPMTLEGYLVRLSDIIAYLGRDIEDAMRMKMISFADIPDNIKKVLGTSNSMIINTIVNDIIDNSLNKNYIKMSMPVFEAVKELKKFNYDHIYSKSLSETALKDLENKFRLLINKYLEDLDNHNTDSLIYQSYLNNMDEKYLKNNSKERIVIDYVAGMTDSYFLKQVDKLL